MRLKLAIALTAASSMAMTGLAAAEPANQSFASDGNYSNIASIGLITTLGPTGLFQNATSGILPKNAFSIESCMAFKENKGDHFQSNGVLVSYGVTDWLEISGFGLIVHGLDPARVGDSHLEIGQVHARARLLREDHSMPEISVGGIVGFGDEPLVAHSVFLAGSKGFTLNDGDFMRSFRLHAGIRQSWLDKNDIDVTTAFFGAELEVVKDLFLVGDVNTRDNDYLKTPWSAGLQYKSNSFGFSAAVLQAPNETRETYYVGIGVSY